MKFLRVFKRDKSTYSSLPAREKKKIIREATRGANEDQHNLVRDYQERCNNKIKATR